MKIVSSTSPPGRRRLRGQADRFTPPPSPRTTLLYNRNAIFGRRRAPVLLPARAQMRETHRVALVAATSGSRQVLPRHRQRTAPRTSRNTPPAAQAATPRTPPWRCMPRRLTTRARSTSSKAFASFHGPDFYSLPRNTGTITLRRESWTPPESFVFGEAEPQAPARWRSVAVAPGVERIDGCTLAAALEDQGEPLASCPKQSRCAGACRAFSRPPGAFCAPERSARGQAYEQFIWDTRCVPTRDNLHDFSTVWCGWNFRRPSAASTNCRPRPLRADGIGAVRGPLRDALTVLMKTGPAASARCAVAGPARAGLAAPFIELRPLWPRPDWCCSATPCWKKLVSPRKPMVAHVYQAPV